MVFGAKRLPEMGRSLGAGLRGFKDSINGQTTVDELPGANTTTAEPAVQDPEQHLRRNFAGPLVLEYTEA